jgi:hypothetical protein
MPHPERKADTPDQAQGVYRKYRVERVDGKPEKPGAEYFVLDAVNDKHAVPALQAYAASCMTEYPELAKDIARRWLMRVDTSAPQQAAPSVAEAVKPSNEWRKLRISGQQLTAVGLSEEAAAMLCGADDSVLWHELAAVMASWPWRCSTSSGCMR